MLKKKQILFSVLYFFDINIKKLLHSNMQILDQLQKKKKATRNTYNRNKIGPYGPTLTFNY